MPLRPGTSGDNAKGSEDETAGLARAEEIAQRVLSREQVSAGAAEQSSEPAEDHIEWLDRRATGRSARMAAEAELEDVGEVEYRQVRLERVVLVALRLEGTAEDLEASVQEMAALATTAGAQVLGAVVQSRLAPDTATYLGQGKAAELKELAADVGADTIIVDGDLSPSQRRGLEDAVGIKVVDRTAVILDIFAQHAQSKEGKAQVELAQLEYLLPRLRGWGESMSRQTGGRVAGGAGIGSRGPGETKIELDRRRIRSRMARLRKQIRSMAPAREARRSSRRRGQVPAVAIAGYTNAGKSTLLSTLTGTDLLVQDALFATLDPTVRKAETPQGRGFTLTDTVGFVRNLPTQLVEAFRSTLEEIGEADLVLHVVDGSHDDVETQVETVRGVLADVPGYSPDKELVVLNKVDLVSLEARARLRALYPGAVEISARQGEGIAELREAIAESLPQDLQLLTVRLPFSESRLVALAHEEGIVMAETWGEEGVHLTAQVPAALAAELEEFRES